MIIFARKSNENQSLDENTSQKVLIESRRQKMMIDPTGLFKQQTELIHDINKELTPEIFNNFVPNYKNLATIAQILNPDVSAKSRVLLESHLVKILSSDPNFTNKEMVPIDNLVYSTFVKKFNDQYGDNLLEEQKELLSRYIASFHDNAIELSIFLNEEISSLIKSLKIITKI